jgi:hypothetical protein
MRDLEPEKLICDEGTEHPHRQGVVPKPFPEKSDNKKSPYDPMIEQIERRKMLRAHRHLLGRLN